MRTVVDTNVFISAALKTASVPGLAVRLARRRGAILQSAPTREQLLAVLDRPLFSRLITRPSAAWVRTVVNRAESVTITESVVACRDPTDDKFLELAVNGRADLIVTGDADLLELDPFRGIPIVRPGTFVRALVP